METYHFPVIGRRGQFTMLLPGFLGILAPLVYGLARYNYAYTHYGPVAAEHWSRAWFQLAELALMAFLFLLVYRMLRARRFIAVHKNGLRFRLNLFRTRQLRWEAIAGISNTTIQERFLTIPLWTHQKATLYPSVGRPVALESDMQDLPDLISRIKASLYPRLLPSLNESFQAGKWLYFGPIAIQSQGLHLRNRRARKKSKKIIPWEQIDCITVYSGELMVELKDQIQNRGVQRIQISHIPNLELLLQIIQQGVTA